MVDNCWDQYFVAPRVISVKRDQTIILDLDSKVVISLFHKNKHQMPNTDSLIDSISQIITNFQAESSELIFLNIDLKNAYSQLNFHPDTTKTL